jgi:hypothetical protein
MTEPFFHPKSANHSVVNEPAMVMGFLPAALHAKLRRIAGQMGVSQAHLISQFVREALLQRKEPRRELQ